MWYTNVIFPLIMATNNPKRKGKNLRQKKIENLGRRKKTVFKKVYELRKYDGVDVALILRHNGWLFTYPFAREYSKSRHPGRVASTIPILDI